MEKEQARAIVRALRAHEKANAMKALAGGFAIGHGENAVSDLTDEQWTQSGWADVSARDLGYEVSAKVTEALGISQIFGDYDDKDWRNRWARRLAYQFAKIVRQEMETIYVKAEWPYDVD